MARFLRWTMRALLLVVVGVAIWKALDTPKLNSSPDTYSSQHVGTQLSAAELERHDPNLLNLHEVTDDEFFE